MRRAYPILHILLIAALLVAALAMIGRSAPTSSGFFPPSPGLVSAAAIPATPMPDAGALALLVDK